MPPNASGTEQLPLGRWLLLIVIADGVRQGEQLILKPREEIVETGTASINGLARSTGSLVRTRSARLSSSRKGGSVGEVWEVSGDRS